MSDTWQCIHSWASNKSKTFLSAIHTWHTSEMSVVGQLQCGGEIG